MKLNPFFLIAIIPIMLTACMSECFAIDQMTWFNADPVLFKDDFSDEDGGWTTHGDTLSSMGFFEGGFRLQTNVPNVLFFSSPGLNFKDVHLFTRARKLSGSDNNLYGLICRYQNNRNYYALVISSDGYYGIYKMLEGVQTLIAQESMDFNPEIGRGEAENEIQGICQGDQLVLVVNDTHLIQVQDGILTHGDVGLIAGNFSEPGVEILFDDFIVLKP